MNVIVGILLILAIAGIIIFRKFLKKLLIELVVDFFIMLALLFISGFLVFGIGVSLLMFVPLGILVAVAVVLKWLEIVDLLYIIIVSLMSIAFLFKIGWLAVVLFFVGLISLAVVNILGFKVDRSVPREART